MRAVVLASRPEGRLSTDQFALSEVDEPELQEGQVLVRNLYASLDPGRRNLLGTVDGYIAPIPVGAPLAATVVGEVLTSLHPDFVAGDLMVGNGMTAERSVITPDAMCWKLDPQQTKAPSNSLSVLGATGLTAYFGLLSVGRPQAGETVLVSGAAGAVGSIVGQIATIHGCRTVGIAGGPEKAQRLLDEFGYDAAIDYRNKSMDELTAEIRTLCPDGVDVFFDNVGGIQLDAALGCMNFGGRVALCGLISQYDGQEPPVMRNLFQIVANTVRVEGFLIFTFADEFQRALADLRGWIDDGRLTFREDVQMGLEGVAEGYLKLFDGSNQGKVMVQL